MDSEEQNTPKQQNSSKKKEKASILPCVIVFAILTLACIGVLTWALDQWHMGHQCFIAPSFYCFNDWTCNVNCTTGTDGTDPYYDYDFCYASGTSPGLPECIYGVNSWIANACAIGPSGPSGASGIDATACKCNIVTASGGGSSCFEGCPYGLSGAAGSCCCCPGTTGCYLKSTDPLPTNCLTNGATNNCPNTS